MVPPWKRTFTIAFCWKMNARQSVLGTNKASFRQIWLSIVKLNIILLFRSILTHRARPARVLSSFLVPTLSYLADRLSVVTTYHKKRAFVRSRKPQPCVNLCLSKDYYLAITLILFTAVKILSLNFAFPTSSANNELN